MCLEPFSISFSILLYFNKFFHLRLLTSHTKLLHSLIVLVSIFSSVFLLAVLQADS